MVFKMVLYYCELCETSHPEYDIDISTFCPSCGERYCIDSINGAIRAGEVGCRYCDASIMSFNNFPWDPNRYNS